MKIVWEKKDIRPGTRVGHPDRSEQWIIAYFPGVLPTEPRYTLVSLSDGMIASKPETAEDIAVRLTESGEIPAEFLTMKFVKGQG